MGASDCLEPEAGSAVAILAERTVDGVSTANFTCSGVLLLPDVALTAAHCLGDPNSRAEGFELYVTPQADLRSEKGSTSVVRPEDAVPVKTWVVPESYDPRAFQNAAVGLANFSDICLVFLDRPINNPTARLITSQEADLIRSGLPVLLVGWGQRGADVLPTAQKSEGRKGCASSVLTEIASHELRIGSDQTQACVGDSGGPVFADFGRAGGRRLIGIVSHTYDFQACAGGAVSARLDPWLGWIEKRLAEHRSF